jgi:uncharacterized phiE125 gp8 family phage protein
MWTIKTTTAATTNAVTAAEAKSQCRVDHSNDDTYIGVLITAAQNLVEAYTNRRLIQGTFVLLLEEFPKEGIYLPYSPVTSVDSIKYYDAANTQQTWSSSEYYYNIYEEPCLIRYVDGDYPDVYDYRSHPIEVTFKTGYTTPDVVPPALKQAILILVADMYENRLDTPRERFTAWRLLCSPYIVPNYGCPID